MNLTLEDALGIRSELTNKIVGNIYTVNNETFKVMSVCVWPKDKMLKDWLKRLPLLIKDNEKLFESHPRGNKNDHFNLFIEIAEVDDYDSTFIISEIAFETFVERFGLSVKDFLRLCKKSMGQVQKKVS
ncbi:MAG TPA: hypothetical protein VGC75_06785 [Candidatus Nitrosocosmicus sp.]